MNCKHQMMKPAATGGWFDCLDPKVINDETESGQRAGLLLDLAEAVSKLRDEGLLQIEPTNVLR